ncbi:MAG: hypothetical protein WCR67_05155 [Bacilli bacterium]
MVSKGDNLFDLNITCLIAFEDKIKIDYIKFYYEEDNVYLDMKYNISLIYNEDYVNSFSFSYSGNNPNSTFVNVNEKDKGVSYYLILRLQQLGLSKSDSFLIKDFDFLNSDLSLLNKQYAINTPYVSTENGIYYDINYLEYDYQDFNEVDLKDCTDNRTMDGIVLKFNILTDSSFKFQGGDIMFSCIINGDSHKIPLHIQVGSE